MYCPQCNLAQPDSTSKCLRCGFDLSAYRQEQRRFEQQADENVGQGQNQLERETRGFAIWGKGVLLLGLIYFTYHLFEHSLIMFPYYHSFIHGINLIFHEAGHWIFGPFGEFMMFLGGTLGQLLIPLICLLVFLLKEKELFSASVMLWWLGENLMDIAPYINDARDRNLILLGGKTGQETTSHDWENILIKLNALRYDHDIANFIFALGKVVMIGALVLGAVVLARQVIATRRTNKI